MHWFLQAVSNGEGCRSSRPLIENIDSGSPPKWSSRIGHCCFTLVSGPHLHCVNNNIHSSSRPFASCHLPHPPTRSSAVLAQLNAFYWRRRLCTVCWFLWLMQNGFIVHEMAKKRGGLCAVFLSLLSPPYASHSFLFFVHSALRFSPVVTAFTSRRWLNIPPGERRRRRDATAQLFLCRRWLRCLRCSFVCYYFVNLFSGCCPSHPHKYSQLWEK